MQLPRLAVQAILHRDDGVVDGPRFRKRVLDPTRLLRSKLRDDSLKRHAAVWLEETIETGRVYYSRSRADRVWAELDAMFWRVI